MMYWFGGMGFFGGLLMLLAWAAIVALVVWAVRVSIVSRRIAEDENDTALAILKRRYAAGEISQTEYEQARRVLDNHAA